MILLNLLLLKSPPRGLTEEGRGKGREGGKEFALHLEKELKKAVKKEELKPSVAPPLHFRAPELLQKNPEKPEVKGEEVKPILQEVKTSENLGKVKVKTAKATGKEREAKGEAGSSLLKTEVKSALKEEETTLKEALPEEKREVKKEEKSSSLSAEKGFPPSKRKERLSSSALPPKEVAKEGEPSKTTPLAEGKGAETFHPSEKSKKADEKKLSKPEVARPTLKGERAELPPLKQKEVIASVKKEEGAPKAVATSLAKGKKATLLKAEKVGAKESKPLKTVQSGEKVSASFKGKKVKTSPSLKGEVKREEASSYSLKTPKEAAETAGKVEVREGGGFREEKKALDFPKHSPFKPLEGSFFQTSAGNHFQSSPDSPLSHPQEAKPPAPQPSNSFYSFFVKSGGVALRMAVRNRTINLNLQLPQGFVIDGELLNEIRAVIKSAGFNPGKLYLKVKGRTAYSKEAKGEIRV